jgi:hypothetical protein
MSNLWHENTSKWWSESHQGFGSADQHLAFCAAKDWLQDTAEVLWVHRRQGFNEDPHLAHLEFWGVLQAAFIQQDAISELHYSLTGNREFGNNEKSAAWSEIRDLRNLAVGHPTRRGQGIKPKTRCVSGQAKKSYDRIPLQVSEGANVQTQTVDLGSLLDKYDEDAAQIMECLYSKLETQLDLKSTS